MPSNHKKIYDPVEVDADFFAENENEQERFYSLAKTLPTPIVNILFGEDTAVILEKISLNFGLNENQSALLSRLIRKVLVADFYIGELPGRISSSLGLDSTKAKEIARSVASELFADASEEIKRVQISKFPQASAQKQPNPVQKIGNTDKNQKETGADLPETGGNIIDLRAKN